MKDTHLQIMINLFSKLFNYKPEASVIIAGTGVTIATFMQWLLQASFLGVTAVLILLTCVLIIVDFIYGLSAAMRSKDYKGLEVDKITYTIVKFIFFFIWILLAFSVKHELKNIEWVQYIISAITSFPIFLINLREFVSIGKSIEKIYGKKPYVFELVDKIFLSIEKMFIRKLSDNVVDELQENLNEPNNQNQE